MEEKEGLVQKSFLQASFVTRSNKMTTMYKASQVVLVVRSQLPMQEIIRDAGAVLSQEDHLERSWQLIQVFFGGEFHGQRAFQDCTPQGSRVGHDRATQHSRYLRHCGWLQYSSSSLKNRNYLCHSTLLKPDLMKTTHL